MFDLFDLFDIMIFRFYTLSYRVLFEKEEMNMNKTDQEKIKEAVENLAHIKMITSLQKKDYGKKTGPYFIIWGILWFIGFSFNSLSVSFNSFWIWLVLSIVGWGFTIFTWFRQEKKTPMPSFIQNQMVFMWVAFGIIFSIFLFLVVTGLLNFNLSLISLYMIILVVIMYALLSIVFGKEILFMSIWLAVLSGSAFLWFTEFLNIIYAILGGGSMVIIGLLLKRGN